MLKTTLLMHWFSVIQSITLRCEQGGRLWSHEEGCDLRQAQTALHVTGLPYWFLLSSFSLMSFLFISLSSSLTCLLTLLCEHRQEEWISPIRELLRFQRYPNPRETSNLSRSSRFETCACWDNADLPSTFPVLHVFLCAQPL